MKRPVLIWCLAPFIFALFHLAFGKKLQLAEIASEQRRLATESERTGRFSEARNLYNRAKSTAHPSDFALRARLDTDIARIAILSGAPLEAARQMAQLSETLMKRRQRLPVEEEVKATRALALYFAAYALRLESPMSEVWRNEAQTARRLFRELHETAKSDNRYGDTLFYGRNLEASILLERSRQAELTSAPTPGPVLAAVENGIAAQKLRFGSTP